MKKAVEVEYDGKNMVALRLSVLIRSIVFEKVDELVDIDFSPEEEKTFRDLNGRVWWPLRF